MDSMIDLVGYWFGEVADDERDRIEAALMADPELLAEYFAMKRRFEQGDGNGPRPHVRDRLEAELFDAPRPEPRFARNARSWMRWAGAGLVAAASIAALWWLVLRPNGTPAGRLVDTARPEAESGHTL